jgi:nucleoside-diphosphate-sugar epimerase
MSLTKEPSKDARAQDQSTTPSYATPDEVASVQSVLVTGAAGFIGSHLSEACLALGWRVIALDSFTDYYAHEIKADNSQSLREDEACTFLDTDLLDVDLNGILSDVDIVFHLAAQPGVRASWGEGFGIYVRNNLTALQYLLEAARDNPSTRLVIASSSSVYGDAESFPTSEEVILRPVSPYGMTKAAGEHLAHVYWRSYETSISMLRYFTVYGPRQRPDMAFHRLVQTALTNREFTVFGDGHQTRDFTYVDDAVQGTIAAGLRGKPGRAYNIGGGSRHAMTEVFATLQTIAGKPLNLTYAGQQRGDARDTSADVSRAERDLGYRPTRSLREGLAEQFSWHQSHTSLLI